MKYWTLWTDFLLYGLLSIPGVELNTDTGASKHLSVRCELLLRDLHWGWDWSTWDQSVMLVKFLNYKLKVERASRILWRTRYVAFSGLSQVPGAVRLELSTRVSLPRLKKTRLCSITTLLNIYNLLFKPESSFSKWWKTPDISPQPSLHEWNMY